MTNKLTLTEQEELFAKDCKLINLKYEYNGYTGDEKWAIITELSVKELWEKYPLVIERYSPFVHLSIAQGEVIDDTNRNEDKYAKRSSRTLLAKGFREAGQTAANAFRTFADKPEVDYSQKEQKHPITKAVLAPMKAVKKMLVSMELHLDASIDKLDNLAMNVQLDKEKHMENAKAQEQTEPERAEAERVEAEVVYSPMVAEPQEYQYNADAFEARDADEVKQEAAYKEVSKVREDKAR